jgi:hypothetical protein
MTSTNVKRSLIKTFLNIGTTATPIWTLIGDGIATASIKYSPQILDETYIHQDSATIDVESYKPTLPVKASVKVGDPAFNFVDNIRMHRYVLSDARAEIVNVWLYTSPTLNQYQAERQSVSIQIDDFGGDGGKEAVINYTINFIGDPILGTFNPLTLAFTPVPNQAGLASLTIGTLTLSPTFNTSQLYYTAPTTDTTGTISATAVNSGTATIVIKNGSTTVSNGGSATWTTGQNTVTVAVTVGAETCTYTVVVSK